MLSSCYLANLRLIILSRASFKFLGEAQCSIAIIAIVLD